MWYKMELDDAGWSSLVARRAHNPKVTGSNPVPATKYKQRGYPETDNPFFYLRQCHWETGAGIGV